jgi:hypothetical protein
MPNGAALSITNAAGDAIHGTSTSVSDGIGVVGESDSLTGTVATGVYGTALDGPGVWGDTTASSPAVIGSSDQHFGVYGTGKAGVWGEALSGWGIFGQSLASGWAGVCGDGHKVGIGVLGTTTAPSSTGVWGSSTSGAGLGGAGEPGVFGLSETDCTGPEYQDIGTSPCTGVDGMAFGVQGKGVRGTAWNHTGVGVLGRSINARAVTLDNVIYIDGAGVIGYSPQGTAVFGRIDGGRQGPGLAGAFEGPVVVDGDFTVFNGAKSAAVRHPDGSYRRLYSLESPESYFEDFGRGILRHGRARVTLDRDFAAVVRRGTYYVFLTPEGDSNGLYVSRKSATGFEVREQNRGTSNLTFGYRVVAKRKDVQGQRLEKVAVPSFGPAETTVMSKIREPFRSLKVRAHRKIASLKPPVPPKSATPAEFRAYPNVAKLRQRISLERKRARGPERHRGGGPRRSE